MTKCAMDLSPDLRPGKKKLNLVISGIKGIENGADYTLEFGVSVTNEEGTLSINLTVRGFFEFDKSLPEKSKEVFFTSSAPAIVFPYLRAHVSALTALSGIDPVILPTLNFSESLRKTKEQG